MRRYHSYKDSGVEWIGEIPSHWGCGFMKYQLSNNDGGVWGTDIEIEDEGTIVIRSTEITIDGNWDFSNPMKRKLSKEEINKTLLKKGDIVLTKSSGSPDHIGKSVIVTEEVENLFCCYSNFVQRLRFREYSPKLYHYILNSYIVREQYRFLTQSTTGLGNLNGTTLNEVNLPFIPLSEQQQIVSYLDNKTSMIHSLIEKTQRKIELLKEKRTSLINEVDTKGLNPNVEMKDSGVEWIGEIPSHWIESFFRYFIKLRHGYQFRDYDFTDEGIKIIKITQLHKDGYLDITNCSTIDSSRLDDFPDIRIKENDILMCLTGGTIGKIIKVGRVNEPLLQNYRVGHFSSKNEEMICNNFIFFLMCSDVIVGQINYDVRETGQPNIGLEDMNKMRICLPPISEQEEIVSYLDEHTQLIDKTISVEQRRIDLLKDYRQSIISEVVTGKRKVTNDD
jgi:type I restriction enzyme S subunit